MLESNCSHWKEDSSRELVLAPYVNSKRQCLTHLNAFEPYLVSFTVENYQSGEIPVE